MPSTDRTQTLSRRRLLVACGSCTGVGALGGYAYGPDFLGDDDCTPTPLDTSPTDWPLPDYDGANARTAPSESAPPSGLTERWSVRVRHPGQPIAINGSVFVAGIRSPDFLTSYDLSTGEERWTKSIAAGRRLSPVAGGDSLFLPQDSEDEETVSKALATADGSERWTSDVTNERAIPVLEAGLIVFRTGSRYDRTLTAIDARTGEECWQASIADRPRSSAVYAGETIVLNTGTDGEIVSLDAQTGEQRWAADISDYFHPNEDLVNDAIRGRIVAGTERVFFHTFGGLLLALGADTGETDWVTPETHPEISSDTVPPVLEPIAFSNDSLLVIESDGTDRPDRLRAIDPRTGGERWTVEPEAEEDARIRSAAVAGETVFLPVMEEFHRVDLASGDLLETHDLDGYAQSVTLADGVCLVATTEGIVAFEEE